MINNLIKISKFISFALRHHPEEVGLTVDEHGWANTNELIKCAQTSNFNLSKELLIKIVAEDDKQRYSLNEDKTMIRANQGHSFKVDLELKAIKPPNLLFHGTAKHKVDLLRKEGIKSMSRQHVHLSETYETAEKVGKRHGEPEILVIKSKLMYEEGYKFYQSKNGVWLVDYIPPKYIADIGGVL